MSPALDAGEAYRHYAEEGIYDELHRAIAIAEDELRRLADDDPAWPRAADRLASFLGARFRHSGDEGDLDRALRVARPAVERSGQDAVLRARLGGLLRLQFVRDGRLSVLDEAIDEARAAAASADGPAADAETAEILAELLLTRYRTTAERELPADALSLLYAAARRQREAGVDVSAAMAGAMGAAHIARFDQTDDRQELENAIGALDFSLEALGSGPEFVRRLDDDALARARLYEVTGDEGKLQMAYVSLVMALGGVHDKAPDRRAMKLALGSVRVHRLPRERLIRVLEHDGITRKEIDRLEEMDIPPWWSLLQRAVTLATEALEELPQGSPERPAALAVLARLHRDAYEQSGNVVDHLRQAAGAAAQGAAEWESSFAAAPVAQKLGVSSQGAELHELAVDALLEIAHQDSRYQDEAHAEAFRLAEAAKARLLTEQMGRGEVAIRPDVSGRLVKRERSLLTELVALDTAALAARDSGVAFRPDSERRERLAAELAEVWAAIADRNPSGAEYVALRRGDALDLPQMGEVVMGLNPPGAVLSLYILDDRTVLFSADSDGSGFRVDEVPVGRRPWNEALRRFEVELPRSYGEDLMPPTWEMPLRPFLSRAAELLKGYGHVLIVPHGPARAAVGVPDPRLGGVRRRTARRLGGTGARGGRPAQQAPADRLARLGRDRQPDRRSRARRGGGRGGRGRPPHQAADRSRGNDQGAEHCSVEGEGAAPRLPRGVRRRQPARQPHRARGRTVERARRAQPSARRRPCGAVRVRDRGLRDARGRGARRSLAGVPARGVEGGIVSLWPVSDAAAAELMRVFHTHWAAEAPAAVALRAAAEAVRSEREHPWYWAAFALIGG